MISDAERMRSVLQMLAGRYDDHQNVTVQKVFDRHLLREFGLSMKNASLYGRKITAQLIDEGVLEVADENIAKAANILRIDIKAMHQYMEKHNIPMVEE